MSSYQSCKPTPRPDAQTFRSRCNIPQLVHIGLVPAVSQESKTFQSVERTSVL